MDRPARDALLGSIFGPNGACYDDVVAAATRGSDLRWKEDLLAALRTPRRVLDLACGTGILTFLMRERFPECEVVGVDITPSYLDVARARAAERGDGKVRFVLAAAEDVEPDGLFDAITSCYLPKFADLPLLVPRLAACLAPGGVVAMQDFAYPTHPMVRETWEIHFAGLERWAEETRPETSDMFHHLPRLIRATRWVEELSTLLTAQGLDVAVTKQGWGTSALVVGTKPT